MVNSVTVNNGINVPQNLRVTFLIYFTTTVNQQTLDTHHNKTTTIVNLIIVISGCGILSEVLVHMSETSEEEYVPEPDPESDESLERDKREKGKGGKHKGGKDEGWGRKRTQGEDSRSRSRAPSRGPGCRARQCTGALKEEDRVRIAQLTADSITEMQVGHSYYV